MGAFPIVLDAPLFDLATRVVERHEDVLVPSRVCSILRRSPGDSRVCAGSRRREGTGEFQVSQASPALVQNVAGRILGIPVQFVGQAPVSMWVALLALQLLHLG